MDNQGSKFNDILADFKKAVGRLSEVLALTKTDVTRDSAIQRFEFCFDLSWKLIKEYLRTEKGIICNSPKDCLREAFLQGLIEYDDIWLDFLDKRNMTSHTYEEKMAESVYIVLPVALSHFQEILKKLSN